MKIRTTTFIKQPADKIWPLLTQSRMDVPGCFCLGVPKPSACELPDGVGGVGSERRCISDRGVVIQRITGWTPPHRLQFEMVTTDHCWSRQVEAITEEFVLEPRSGGTQVTRITSLIANRPFKCIKELGFYFGLKRVHYYVFKNWRAQ